MKTEINIPKLRFREFNGGWKEERLDSVSDIVGGGTPSTSISKYWNGDINWFSPIEIGDSKYVSVSRKKITILGLKKSSAKILPKGSLLFTSRAGIGKTAILLDEASTNQGFQSIVPHKNKLETEFLYCITNKLSQYGNKMGSGSTFVEVSGKTMGKMKLILPSFIEQQRIGSFFSKVDRIIELQTKKLEQLKKLKQAYLQKMFPQNGESLPRLRFSVFSGKWEECKIKDIIGYRRGSFPQPYGNKEWYDKNGYKFAQVVDINDNMHMNMDTKLHISKKAAQKSVLAKVGTILITIQGSIGRIAITEYDTFVDRTILVIDEYYRDIDKYFLMTLLFKLFDLKKKKAPGSTIKTITKKELSEFNILIPNFSEQQRIGSFLRELDELINNQTNKIEILKQQKKAYLQKMFI